MRCTLLFLAIVACGNTAKDSAALGDDDDDDNGTTDPFADADNDGFPAGVDCDDTDPTVNPDAVEIVYDGIDNDCNPDTLDDDLDGDGYPIVQDCDDNDPAINPAATEIRGDGIDNDCNPGTCFGTGFEETPIHWLLPDYPQTGGILPLGEFSEPGPDCVYNQPQFGLLDLTGDGQLDFVVVEEPCDDQPAVGLTEWLVYIGEAGGYSVNPTSWSLPPYPQTGGILPLAEFVEVVPDCYNGQPEFSILDMNGDGFADFVVVEEPCVGDPTVGITEWKVYEGSATGFAQSATSWTLPPYPQTGGTIPLGEIFETAPDCPNNQPQFAVFDITGDGIVDFVVVEEPCAGDPSVGITEWKVFAGSAMGFAQNAMSWSLPPYPKTGGGLPLGALAETAPDCDDNKPQFALMDLDGDARIDFVVVEEPCAGDPVIGITEWKYYAGTPNGFAQSATRWTLPPYPQTGAIPLGEFAQSNPDCADNRPEFGVLDLNGDAVADFVVVEEPCPGDPAVGITDWAVYLGSTSGFSQSPTEWTLPSFPKTGGTLPLGELIETRPDCPNNQPQFKLLDITGNGRTDFVVVEEPCGSATVGISEWRVYPSICEL